MHRFFKYVWPFDTTRHQKVKIIFLTYGHIASIPNQKLLTDCGANLIYSNDLSRRFHNRFIGIVRRKKKLWELYFNIAKIE